MNIFIRCFSSLRAPFSSSSHLISWCSASCNRFLSTFFLLSSPLLWQPNKTKHSAATNHSSCLQKEKNYKKEKSIYLRGRKAGMKTRSSKDVKPTDNSAAISVIIENNSKMKKKKKKPNRKRPIITADDPKKPKKPPTAFFYYLEDFRKTYQAEHPDIKSMRDIGKACGDKWKTMNFEEKVQYYDIATEKRADYEKAMVAYLKRKESGELSDESDSEYT